MALVGTYANAQSPEEAKSAEHKIEQVTSKMTPEQLENLKKDPRLAGWSDEVLNKFFYFKPDDPKAQVRDIPELNLGGYGRDLKVAKVTNTNHTKDGRIKYLVDISDKRYLESKIFDRIKEYNPELSGAIIQFAYRGSVIPSRTIKL